MFNKKTIHIELHLPKSWNQCTTEELEIIAAAIIEEQQRVDRYHPFEWSRVKLNVVLVVNNLHVVSKQSATDDDSDSTFIVKRSKEEGDFPIRRAATGSHRYALLARRREVRQDHLHVPI